MLEKYSDNDLVELLASGLSTNEDKAIAYLLQKHSSDIDNFLFKKGISEANDRKSILYDAIVELLLKCRKKKFKVEVGNSIRKYLFVVSRNIMYKKWRSIYQLRNLKLKYHEDQIEECFLKKMEQEEDRNLLIHMISSLGEKCRQVLFARYYFELKHEEIAPLVNLKNAQGVRNKQFKCLKKLREKYFKLKSE